MSNVLVTKGLQIGHPILRRRNPKLGRPFRPWWVVIGRSAPDRDDEVWSQRPELLRCIREVLDPERGWGDAYKSKANLSYDKPFVSRSIAERELNEAVNSAEALGLTNNHLNWTKIDNAQWSNGQLTERLFDLLVEEKVLVNPTVHEIRPCVRTTLLSKSSISDKPLEQRRLWKVDSAAADVWLATRLLLLEDNR